MKLPAALRPFLIRTVLIFCVVLPLICGCCLETLYYYEIAGNVAYGILDSSVYGLIAVLDSIAVFAGYAVLVSALTYGDKRTGLSFAVTVALTEIIPYATGFLNLRLSSAQIPELYQNMLVYAWIGYGLDLLFLLLLALAVCLLPRIFKNASKSLLLYRSLWVTAGMSLIRGWISATQTAVNLIMTYGGPQNLSEWITLLTPYGTTAALTAVGFAVMYVLTKPFKNTESVIA